MNTNVSKHYGIFSVLWLVALVIFPFGSSWSRVHARESSNAAPATELVVSTIAHLNFMPLVFRAVPNVAPTDILLSLTTVAENMPINTWIGMFSTTDPNAGDTFTYSLVSGAGDSGNGSFNISGHILRSSVVFDYETQNSYSIRVRSTDQGGLFFEKVFTITITYVAQNPTDILLSNSTIQENLPVNTVVGTLSTTDPNAGDTFTYALVSGAGDTGNGSFNIAGNQLRSSVVFDYETQNSYSIRVRTTDQGGLYFEKVFTITIQYLAQAPTDILLSPTTVPENMPINTWIGMFSTTDPNAGDTFTYSLVSGAGDSGNGSFNISGHILRSSVVFDYETQNSYSIRVRTTDQGGLFFEKVFTITILINWETLVNTTFEGDFPGPWVVHDNDGNNHGEYYWAPRSCMPYAGSNSGWAVGGGANGGALPCGSNYPNYADSRMVFGPFSLVDATAAKMDFKLWLNSEIDYDYVCRMASINGLSFYGSCTSGSSGGWIDRTLDLSNVYQLGDLRDQPQVWVAIIFYSDVIWNYPEGAYVDNVYLRKCMAPSCPGQDEMIVEEGNLRIVETPMTITLGEPIQIIPAPSKELRISPQ